jgi:CrcB protein
VTFRGLGLIAIGGVFGTLGRALLSGYTSRLLGTGFPYATSLVNVLGCFLFGLVWAFLDKHWPTVPEYKLLLLTGFMGAFTTFSTYLFETHALLLEARLMAAGANLLIQNALGLLALYGGLTLARAF